MDEIMPEVRTVLREVIGQLRTGERCSVYAFGDTVRRIGDRRIDGDTARDTLQASVQRLEPTDRYTDVTTALRRGMGLLRREFRETPNYVPILIAITDGRHNPRDAKAPTFDQLQEAFSDFRAGEQWFLHYVVLGEFEDPLAEKFVREMHGAFTAVEDLENLRAVLQAMPTPATGRIVDQAGGCSIRRTVAPPEFGPCQGFGVESGYAVETDPDGRLVLGYGSTVRVGLDVATLLTVNEATWDPLRYEGRLRLRLYSGAVEILTREDQPHWDVRVETPHAAVQLEGTRLRLEVSAEGRATEVGVRRGSVRVQALFPALLAGSETRGGAARTAVEFTRVLAGQQAKAMADGAVTAPGPLLEPWARVGAAWDKSLVREENLSELALRLVRAAFTGKEFRLGPLIPDGRLRETIPLVLAGVPDEWRRGLDINLTGVLPETVRIESGVRPGILPGQFMIPVDVYTGADFPEGTPADYRVTAAVVADAGAGREFATFGLNLWAEGAPPPPVTTAASGFGARTVVLTGAVVAVLLLSLTFVLYRSPAASQVGVREHALGRLLVIAYPASEGRPPEPINLDRFLMKRGSTAVHIGRDSHCDITLHDASVKPQHCRLTLWRNKTEKGVGLARVAEARVRVDDQPIAGKKPVEINDQARIQVGAYTFLYEDTQAQSHAILHFKSGNAVQGVLHSWDFSAPRFRFAPIEPMQALRTESVWEIAFAEVEDVFMLAMETKSRSRRKTGRSSKKADERRTLTVIFPSGREVHGELWPGSTSDAARFALTPTDLGHVDHVVIVRANTQSIVAGTPETGLHVG